MVNYTRSSSFGGMNLSSRAGSVSTDLHLKNHERRIAQIESKSVSDSSSFNQKIAELVTKTSELTTTIDLVESKLILQSEINSILRDVEEVRSSSSLNSTNIRQNSLVLSRIPSIESTLKSMASDINSFNSTESMVTTLQGNLKTLETRVLILETSGGGNGGGEAPDLTAILARLDALEKALEDLTPGGGTNPGDGSLTERVVALETFDLAQEDINTDVETRVAALEASGGYDDTEIQGLVADNKVSIDALDDRVTTIEVAGGGGGDVDLTPVIARLTAVENENDAQEESLADLVGRVTTLENEDSPTYDDTALRGMIADLDTNKAETHDVNVLRTRVLEAEQAIDALEAGGGGGGSYDDTAIKADITELDSRVTVLEDASGITPPAKKYYILPLGGQSNMLGFGEYETPLDLDKRIWQLGYWDSIENSNTMTNVCKQASGFGDRYRELRPEEDTCLKIIPATPCLDTHANMHWMYSDGGYGGLGYKPVEGGMIGPGIYFARAILPYLPKDYDILIVPVAIGGSGFTNQHLLGTYDAAHMRASRADSFRWGVTTPLGKAFYDRIEHALSTNAENRLLPVLWMQGEDDDDVGEHYIRAKAFIKHIRDQLVADGHESKFPLGTVNNFRWFTLSPPKKYILVDDINTNDGIDLYDAYIDYDHGPKMTTARGNFDNYAFMSEDPEFRSQGSNLPQVMTIRCDLDKFGRFHASASDDQAEAGTPGAIGMSPPDWHYASSTMINHTPQMALAAISQYGNCLAPGPISMVSWTRPVRGKFGSVTTDGIRYSYPCNRSTTFNAADGLVLHHDLSTDVVHVGSKAGGSSYTRVMDSTIGKQVASISTSSHNIKYSSLSLSDADYTISLSFKIENTDRMDNFRILETNTSITGISLMRKSGSPFLRPCWKETGSENGYPNFGLHKYMHGAWNGGVNDWQHFTGVYNSDLKVFHIYFNGCLVESLLDIPASNINEVFVAQTVTGHQKFRGKIANIRVYNKCLSYEQVSTLYYVDLERHINKVKMDARVAIGHGGCACGDSSHDGTYRTPIYN